MVDNKELIEFQKNLKALGKQKDAFLDSVSKEIAQRFLASVVKKTPVGVYSNRTGGTLRRGWAMKNVDFAKVSNGYRITITNPTEYASYVEYGHRTQVGGWVEGQFFLTITEKEMEHLTPQILQKRVKEWLSKID